MGILVTWLKRIFQREQMPEWRKYPNPYLQLHLLIYPSYLKEVDAGTYDPQKDPFCSTSYILSHPFKGFEDIEIEVARLKLYAQRGDNP